jgi:hypothetical protein
MIGHRSSKFPAMVSFSPAQLWTQHLIRNRNLGNSLFPYVRLWLAGFRGAGDFARQLIEELAKYQPAE